MGTECALKANEGTTGVTAQPNRKPLPSRGAKLHLISSNHSTNSRLFEFLMALLR
jgi:hypothetical protein